MKTFYIDLFCGSGGVTAGLSRVKGVKVIACVNHDAIAIRDHKANHPHCWHFTEDVRNPEVAFILARLVRKLRKHYPGCRIIIWASLDCREHTRAKGGKPKKLDSRMLAEELYRYTDHIQPDGVSIENVREFMKWGPLNKYNKPIKSKMGQSYDSWVRQMKDRGFNFEYRILDAADFGAYTSRIRYFGRFLKPPGRIVWPKPTHAKEPPPDMEKWKPVREVLDTVDVGRSMFTRKKPYVEPTERRILRGLKKYAGNHFLMKYHGKGANVLSMDGPASSLTTKDRLAAVFIASYYSGGGQLSSADEPCPTITTVPKARVVTAQFLTSQYGQSGAVSTDKPSPTLTANPKQQVVTAQFLLNPQWGGQYGDIEKPCFTIISRTDKAPPYLVTATKGPHLKIKKTDSPTMKEIKKFMAKNGISDIFVRQLRVDEMLRIMGFPENYILTGNQTQNKKHIGNAVEVGQAQVLAEVDVIENS